MITVLLGIVVVSGISGFLLIKKEVPILFDRVVFEKCVVGGPL
jgi:hypothetical protein